jgi:hypothetical protein
MTTLTKTIKTVYAIITITLLVCCGTTLTGYDFETNASYQASRSKLWVNLYATGHVSAGADIGNGQTIGNITSSQFNDTIYFKTSATKMTALKYGQEKFEITNPIDISGTIANCLNKIGYQNYDSLEMEELGKVIVATSYGPKGTFLKGQTDLITVLEVNFKRK